MSALKDLNHVNDNSADRKNKIINDNTNYLDSDDSIYEDVGNIKNSNYMCNSSNNTNKFMFKDKRITNSSMIKELINRINIMDPLNIDENTFKQKSELLKSLNKSSENYVNVEVNFKLQKNNLINKAKLKNKNVNFKSINNIYSTTKIKANINGNNNEYLGDKLIKEKQNIPKYSFTSNSDSEVIIKNSKKTFKDIEQIKFDTNRDWLQSKRYEKLKIVKEIDVYVYNLGFKLESEAFTLRTEEKTSALNINKKEMIKNKAKSEFTTCNYVQNVDKNTKKGLIEQPRKCLMFKNKFSDKATIVDQHRIDNKSFTILKRKEIGNKCKSLNMNIHDIEPLNLIVS